MSDPVFDLDTWEPLFKVSEDLSVDSNGDFSMRMGKNMAMNLETGKMRFTTPWPSGDDSEAGD